MLTLATGELAANLSEESTLSVGTHGGSRCTLQSLHDPLPFRNDAEATPELFNSAQTSDGHETTKVAVLKEAQKSRNPHSYEGEGEI
jgi:uncharacterized protein (DUF2249 family)